MQQQQIFLTQRLLIFQFITVLLILPVVSPHQYFSFLKNLIPLRQVS